MNRVIAICRSTGILPVGTVVVSPVDTLNIGLATGKMPIGPTGKMPVLP